MKYIVFCHGFPFHKSFFNNLRSLFEQDYKIIELNLGYIGKKENLDDFEFQEEESLAIGHGYGFVKLIESGYKFKGYIGISTLLNYMEDETLKRQYQNLKYAFSKDSIGAISGHIARLGAPALVSKENLNMDTIKEDIEKIYSSDITVLVEENKSNILFLHGQNDVVFDVATAIKQMENHNLIGNTVEGHALGHFGENWCAYYIKEFIKLLDSNKLS